MKKTTKKLLAVLVAMVMMVGCVSVAAFAQWGRGPQNELKADTMVVLGDSIPSGYGMHGDAGNAYTLGNQFTFGHGGYVEGTYPQLVADTLGVQNRYNYSRDAFRSVEIRRLIDPEYEALRTRRTTSSLTPSCSSPTSASTSAQPWPPRCSRASATRTSSS